MVQEMVGGCCVCLDERGWDENPLVYCDGSGCNVAVHQACYGIVKVPSGPWFCCKCRSTERVARVKCELCPKKDGALKRTDNGGWAHVVCALYIPEVRFGNVSTMEPIIFSSVPHDRFTKTCYICDESGRDYKLIHGACMACHKAGCKLYFHVTCAQEKRLLCEEASINSHVQYVGYCKTHWTKRFKQPASQSQVSEQDVKKHLKDKAKSRTRNESTSSTNSVENTTKNYRHRKLGRTPDSNKNSSESNVDDLSPVIGDTPIMNDIQNFQKKASMSNSQNKSKDISQSKHKDSSLFSGNGLLLDSKSKISSPLNTPVSKEEPQNSKESDKDSNNGSSDDDEPPKVEQKETKKRKIKEKEKLIKRPKLKKEESNVKDTLKVKKQEKIEKKKEKKNIAIEKEEKNEKKNTYPQPSQLDLIENGKVSSWDFVTSKTPNPPDNFQDFLEHQWNQSTEFILAKAEHFDVASLLTCLHQLKSDNMKLEGRLKNLQSRRDRLLGLNARLAASFTNLPSSLSNGDPPKSNSLSAMLSKLNDSNETNSNSEKSEKKQLESRLIDNENGTIASPDLAMLAAASAKIESTTRINRNELSSKNVPSDEKPPAVSFQQDPDSVSLVQPSLSVLNSLPSFSRASFERDQDR